VVAPALEIHLGLHDGRARRGGEKQAKMSYGSGAEVGVAAAVVVVIVVVGGGAGVPAVVVVVVIADAGC